jgi:hypothetical protein
MAFFGLIGVGIPVFARQPEAEKTVKEGHCGVGVVPAGEWLWVG